MNETKKINATRADYVLYYGCLAMSIVTGFATLTVELGLVIVSIGVCRLMDVSAIQKTVSIISIYFVMLFTAGVLTPTLRQLDNIYNTIDFNPKRIALGTTGACCGMLLLPLLALVSCAAYCAELEAIIAAIDLRKLLLGCCLAITVGVNLLFDLTVKLIKKHYERQGFRFDDKDSKKTKKTISRSPR